jgi:uncharacterized protein (DUF1778 family)
MNDTKVTYVSPETFDWLMEKLNEEPKDMPGLRTLLNRPSPFENEPPETSIQGCLCSCSS